MISNIELLFYDRFILLKNMLLRLKADFVVIKCIGVEDGETVEVYVNDKMNRLYVVRDGEIRIPVESNKRYRITSKRAPYGFRFNVLPANDNTGDKLLFQTISTEPSETKNIYRIVESLCSEILDLKKKVEELSGYQTE